MKQHSGNLLNQITFEEHDGDLNAKKVSIIGASVALPVSFSGNVTISDSKGYIGLVTATLGAGDRYIGLVTNTQVGLVTLAPSPNYIGLASVNIGGGNVGINGNVTLSDAKTFIGLVTTVPASNTTVTHAGLVTLAPSPSFIGLVTVGGIGTVTLADPKGFIGLVTVVQASTNRSIVGNVTLSDAKTYIGLVTVGGIGTITLADPKGFIGLVTIGGMSTVTLADPKGYIGLVTIGGIGTLTLADPKGFIGLVTAVTRNAGTNKTLFTLPVTLSTSSQLTIAIPATNQAIYPTNILINSDATVRVSIKSGVTYLTGNASIGVTLNPGGGWIETGSPDSPTYIGLPSGALVLEKFDMTGTKANVGGKITYFTE